MERVFRSLKTEWIPTVGYMTAHEAHRDISHYLMHRYNWMRPHQFNGGLAPARPRKNLTSCPGLVDHYSIVAAAASDAIEFGAGAEIVALVTTAQVSVEFEMNDHETPPW